MLLISILHLTQAHCHTLGDVLFIIMYCRSIIVTDNVEEICDRVRYRSSFEVLNLSHFATWKRSPQRLIFRPKIRCEITSQAIEFSTVTLWEQGSLKVLNLPPTQLDEAPRPYVSQKRAQLWNGIARNYMDRFWWYLAEIFKSLYNTVCMFQFSCRFACYHAIVSQTAYRT